METAVSKSSADLAEAGHVFYRRGWVLGTSGNFSKLLARDPMRISITASGGEKDNSVKRVFSRSMAME